MSTTPEPNAMSSARERAAAKADALIQDYESIIGRPDVLRHLLAVAYLDGEQAGADAAIAVLRTGLSEL